MNYIIEIYFIVFIINLSKKNVYTDWTEQELKKLVEFGGILLLDICR